MSRGNETYLQVGENINLAGKSYFFNTLEWKRKLFLDI